MYGGPVPFEFKREGDSLLDRANGLRIRTYQWPEYNFSVTVEPAEGPQAEAWPVSARAYFEFFLYYGFGRHEVGQLSEATVGISFAHPCVSFDRDFPGRTGELFDHVAPLICPYFVEQWPSASGMRILPVPEGLRSSLLNGRSYPERDSSNLPSPRPLSLRQHLAVWRWKLGKRWRS